MSGCAGVMSSQAANPAKPAPSFCISSIARAGTNLERRLPNKSKKLIKKYSIPLSLATLLSLIAINSPICHVL